MIPQTLYNFNLFIDGKGFVGLATQVTPPKLKLKTEDHRAAGMDAPIKHELGLEALEASFSLAGVSVEALKFFGLADETAFNGTFRGAFKDQKGQVQAAIITLRGLLNEIDMGDWKAGDKAETKYTASLSYYKFEVDGKVVFEVDPLNSVRVIDGVDQLSEIRAAIGL